ncbi:MAG: TetR family transcriptional regulator [Deltaproteobacteria bacterium]|nr:MAG: TetR family transcriptional regulator [Deltaproteobacteria bacterium]
MALGVINVKRCLFGLTQTVGISYEWLLGVVWQSSIGRQRQQRMSSGTKKTKLRRGRPREIDREEVARTALCLFEEKGVDGVTMNEIAEAASISRRTLFRLFPSKGDLVWDGIWELLEQTKVQTESIRPQSMTLSEFVEAFFMPGLRSLEVPEHAELARRRLLLVAGSPGLFNHPAFNEMRVFLSSAVQRCVIQQKVPPELLAGSLSSIAISSVIWWAKSNGTVSALDAFRLALGAVAEVQERC